MNKYRLTLAIFILINHLLNITSVLAADAAMITSTCKNTPYFNLCLSSIKADRRSATADLTGLARIMVDKLAAKAAANLQQIRILLKRTWEPRVRNALKECADSYDAVLKYDVSVAVEALTKGDPKFAEQAANDAALEADSCERSFQKSPISSLNKNMHDISVVTAALVRNLL